jgi:PAS domain S-box-containing protein
VLVTAVALVLLIALADWQVHAEAPLGLLYLVPIAIASTLLPRKFIVLLAALCTLLAEEFDSFIWTPQIGITRDFLYFFAFCGVGLFVREGVVSRRRAALHLIDVENEVEARRDAEEQLKILIESSPLAIVTADADGTILLANNAAHRLFSTAPETIAGKCLANYLPAMATVPALRPGQQSFRTVMQCRGQRDDGETFIAEVWFATYLTTAGPRLTAMAVDTSQDLRDREESNLYHLLAGSRILVGAVSHEVRNVCGAIALVHENLARSHTLDGNQDFEALGTLVLALEKIASMDLRQAADQASSVDLYAFLEELRVVIRPSLHEQDIRDHWHTPPNLPFVWADRQSLMQVFLNLTRNAEAALAAHPARELTISTRFESQRVLISFSDSGPGVQNPDLLFKPFQQEARQTGLGLFLSRALMRSFKGDLRYQPGGSGATFVLELLPALDAMDQTYAHPHSEASASAHR